MKPPVEAPASRLGLAAWEHPEMFQGRSQLLTAPADETGRRLQGDGRLPGHQGSGFDRHAAPCEPDPPRQDQGLGLGPAPGQAPGYQQLIQAGLHRRLAMVSCWLVKMDFLIKGKS